MDPTDIVRRQRAFFLSGATRPLEFRRTQLRALLEAMARHEPALLAALHSDLRKSPEEAYTTEIALVRAEARHALGHVASWMKPRRGSVPLLAWPARASVRAEPCGVALIVGPWNNPLQLVLSPLVGAIAGGNCGVLKPSEFAPHTASALAHLIRAAFPEEYIAVVPGERQTAEALLRERFDTIFFTGSGAVGRAVMAAAARHLTPVTLELGGKCPCLVCADAPLELVARRIAWGKFMNAGQTCVAPDFVLVDRRVSEALVAALKKVVVEFYGQDPRLSRDYGRIINRRHLERLIGYLAPGRIAHGGQHDASDLYLAPTILTGVPADAPAMCEEIFGPILPVADFDTIEDALGFLRGRPAPLALYLFTRDRSTQERVLDATTSGGVCLNDTVTHMVGTGLPFGGVGASGLGAYHGKASFDAFTHRRPVVRRSLAVDPPFRYPPPQLSLPGLKRALRWLLGA
jgi:aldehyde dehydrogenase (NAD+)